ncbi:MAG: SDR family oxidoreductase [Acidobacteria bacterium]|nr:SDR family oxidoreductase [Acidobacteriota bacterium]
MKKLTGKVALITGASMGIGEAIARVFAAEGAKLAMASRSLDKLEALARALPTEAIALQADMTKPQEIRAMVVKTVDHFGRIDILVNNAAVGMYAAVADMKPEQFEHLVATNWLGPVHAIQAVVPQMRRQGAGTIVNISSVAGKVALPWMGAYCASKFALNALSNSLRMELGRENIHVVSVCPGRVKTAFTQNAYKDFATSPLYPGGISAERVARAVLRAVHRRRREIVVPADNRLFGWLHGLFPRLVDRAIVLVLRPQMRKN